MKRFADFAGARNWLTALVAELFQKVGGELFRRGRFTLALSNQPTHTAAMKTTWKDIAPVPTSQEFLDIVLSRTQRRLPTQIRAGFKISRIRGVFDFSLPG